MNESGGERARRTKGYLDVEGLTGRPDRSDGFVQLAGLLKIFRWLSLAKLHRKQKREFFFSEMTCSGLEGM